VVTLGWKKFEDE